MASQGPNTQRLYQMCQQAEKLLEQIATGFGQVNADPQVVRAFSQMADVTRRVCQSLAKRMKQEMPDEPAAQRPRTMDEAAEAMMAEARARRQAGQ